MARKTQWHQMTWREIKQAQEEGRVVLIPAGTVETQGKHTAIGFEFVLPQRLAEAVAARTNAIVTPVIPFGWSADFVDYPGTISLRPSTLEHLYEDVVRSVLHHGFDHVVFLATHIPNQQMIEQLAYRIRQELGIRIIWTNSGQLANRFLQEVSPEDFAAAKGHGADPGVSLGEFLEPGTTDFSDMEQNQLVSEFMGITLSGWSPNYEGFPVGMPLMLQDLSPQSSGGGDPRFGSAQKGEQIFARMVDWTAGLVETFAAADTRVHAQERNR
jgi:creatinine amidohydrolase